MPIFRKRSIEIFALSFSLLYVSGAVGDTLSQLRLEYEVLRAEAEKPILELETMYRERLKAIQQESVRNGAPDREAAAGKLLDSIALEEQQPVDPKWSQLSTLQTIFVENREERMVAVAPAVKAVEREFGDRVEILIEQLTREKKLEEAAEAKGLLAEIRGHEEKGEGEPSGSPTPSRPSFDFSEGIFYGARMGDSEEELREALEAQGIEVFRTIEMSRGTKNITADGLNFRVNSDDELYQIYVLGSDAMLPGDLKLEESRVSDFERVIGERARETDGTGDRDKYEMETRYLSIDLLTVATGDDTVFSVMITEK
ncbi:MAG: hypothetical protein WD342_07490 [Verrucomicrobiales bacterium]